MNFKNILNYLNAKTKIGHVHQNITEWKLFEF